MYKYPWQNNKEFVNLYYTAFKLYNSKEQKNVHSFCHTTISWQISRLTCYGINLCSILCLFAYHPSIHAYTRMKNYGSRKSVDINSVIEGKESYKYWKARNRHQREKKDRCNCIIWLFAPRWLTVVGKRKVYPYSYLCTQEDNQ